MEHKEMDKKKMTPEEDWVCMVLDQAHHMLDTAHGFMEDMCRRWHQRMTDLKHFREEMKKYFEERMPKPPAPIQKPAPVRTPDIDILDLGTELHLIADLPGVKRDDIDIELMPGSVDIRAKVTAEAEREPQPYKRRERGQKEYTRSLDLPEDIVPEKAKARFTNGVLTVTMPRKEPVEKPKAIRVPVKDTDQPT